MDPDAVMRQVDATGDENDLLDVALGYQQMLDRIADATRRRAVTSQPADENLVLVLLGVLSLKANLDRWLRSAEQAPGSPPQPSPDVQGSILR